MEILPEGVSQGGSRQLERLIVCWSNLTLATKEGPDVLKDNRKRDRKDVEVVQSSESYKLPV